MKEKLKANPKPLRRDVERPSTYVSELEAQSRKLLETTERTAEEMEALYPRMLDPKRPEELDEQIQDNIDSFRRASQNIVRARRRSYEIRDELSARWNDVRPRRRPRIHAPANAAIDLAERQSDHFAKGVGLYKLLWVFYIGSFAGVVIELFWCLITNGYLESRSALVYGPFNPLYGAGAVALSLALYRYRNRGGWLSFLVGMVVGSLVEYLCSWGQEMILGSRSWDYSHLPFNLNGRICLLYSFFWGVLGFLWIKKIYPITSKWILKIPNRIGKVLTWVILVLFAINGAITCAALARWTQRMDGVPATNAYMQFMDAHFTDQRMERIFPNMVFNED